MNLSYRRRLARWRDDIYAGEDAAQAARKRGLGQAVVLGVSQCWPQARLDEVLAFLADAQRAKLSHLAVVARAAMLPIATLIVALLVGGLAFVLIKALNDVIEYTMYGVFV